MSVVVLFVVILYEESSLNVVWSFSSAPSRTRLLFPLDITLSICKYQSGSSPSTSHGVWSYGRLHFHTCLIQSIGFGAAGLSTLRFIVNGILGSSASDRTSNMPQQLCLIQKLPNQVARTYSPPLLLLRCTINVAHIIDWYCKFYNSIL